MLCKVTVVLGQSLSSQILGLFLGKSMICFFCFCLWSTFSIQCKLNKRKINISISTYYLVYLLHTSAYLFGKYRARNSCFPHFVSTSPGCVSALLSKKITHFSHEQTWLLHFCSILIYVRDSCLFWGELWCFQFTFITYAFFTVFLFTGRKFIWMKYVSHEAFVY